MYAIKLLEDNLERWIVDAVSSSVEEEGFVKMAVKDQHPILVISVKEMRGRKNHETIEPQAPTRIR